MPPPNQPPIPMDRDGSRKGRSRSKRANGGDAAAVAAGGGGGRVPRAAGAARGGASAPPLADSMGAGPDVGAATSTRAGGPWWTGASLGSSFPDPSPTSSDWLYPPGGFMNYLQSQNFSPFAQPHPFGNYPNGMHPPENFHFVGERKEGQR
ncbi:hypothetical protein ACP70R_008022 [Stipagrostis hirtigluma subsp. patula]